MVAQRLALGIDVGGSGIKGAPVDLDAGEFSTERRRIATPKKSTPQNVAEVIAELVEHFADQLTPQTPVGITMPAIVHHGVTMSAANIDDAWIGFEAEKLLEKTLQRDVYLVNDADAAGVAESHFGAAKGAQGLVILTTLGTGIGSAMIHNGVLIPNSELGHLEIDGHDAESRAASRIKDEEGLSYKKWAKRLQRYYEVVEFLFSPDLFVVGGGVSRDADEFLPLLKLRTPIVPAKLRNTAGIIGAAHLAADLQERGLSHVTPEIDSNA
ncbi:polyphosphate--glucose phosphotransferase [Propionibacteriaceae bacterium Y2011]